MPIQLPARSVRACRSVNVIGPAVIRLRHARGWTQEDLVAQLQLRNAYATRDIIANIETGRSSATDVLVLAMANVFGVSPAELFPPPRAGQMPARMGLHPVTAARRRRLRAAQIDEPLHAGTRARCRGAHGMPHPGSHSGSAGDPGHGPT